MKDKRPAAICLVIALLMPCGLQAGIVADLHSAVVPVDDQSSQALARGARAALEQVLVKVSGSYEVLQNPMIVEALKGSRSQVQQYAYQREEQNEDELLARFEFDDRYVTQLVAQAGAPLWTANRPTVLAWVVMEDQQGQYFLNWETTPNEARLLGEAFSRRGVPVQLPLFDLADTAAITTTDVWRLDTNKLQSASARYDAEHVAVGRLSVLSTGALLGDWTYFHQDERTQSSGNAPDLAAVLRDGVAMVALKMASRYAVAATGTREAFIHMSVAGVQDYSDYAGIISWLNSLELIDYATIDRIRGDRMELQLKARADASQLAAIIELNEHLRPQLGATNPAQLDYQWQK